MSANQTRARRRRTRRRRMLAAGTGVVVVGAGSAVALAATGSDAAGQRTATAVRASLTEVVEASGTVTSSAKATPGFTVSGTVRSVAVTVGQSVSKGQVLARLDTTSLQDAVDSAGSTLAEARQRLAADESGQTSSSGSSNSSSNSATNASSSSYSADSATYTALTTPAPTPDPLLTKIRAAQRAVLDAQRAVDSGQSAVDAARQTVVDDVTQNGKLRDAQKAACATGPDATTGPATDACASASADYEAFADTLSSDAAGLDAKVTAQDGLLHRLDGAVTALDTLLRQVKGTSAGGTTTKPTGGKTTTPGQPTKPTSNKPTTNKPTTNQPSGTTTPSSNQPSSSSTTTTASAAQLAADQAAIDSAKAQLRAAQQDLGAATLRSPISGKVAAVGLSAGAGSSGGTVTIVGTGVPRVDAAVPLAQIGEIKVGQAVQVAADGVNRTLTGTVSSIGLLSSTSGSVTSFPVVVQLAAGTPSLFDGAGADVRITTGTAHDVVAVPNSAIHTLFRGVHTVTVVQGSKTSTVRVTLGVAGPALTQVLSGLRAGQRVLIADYGTSVPASSTDGSNSRRGFFPVGGGNFSVVPRGSR